MRGGAALRQGFAQAIALWPAALFLFLANAAQALVVPAGALLFRIAEGGAVVLGLLALGTVWLIAALLRALALGGAVREASLRLRALPPGGFLDAALAASPRSIGYLVAGFLLDFIVSCYRWIALLATGGAYIASLVNGEAGFLSAGGLALAIVVCIPLGLMVMLWTQVALARAVAREQGYLVALADSAAELWAKPWPPFAVVAATALIGWAVELFFSIFTSMFTRLGGESPADWTLMLWGQLVSGLIAALVWAFLDVVRLDGLAALELDAAGLLPAPPEPPAAVPPPAPEPPPVAPILPDPGAPPALPTA